ncbi:MAG: hypothetical protein RLZZ366_1578 [Pseudomonadota bacterium]|jgi:hypothetical protein
MRRCSKLVGLALLGLWSGQATAQAVSSTCLTRAEATGLMTYALPTAISAVVAQCSATLPSTSGLVQSGAVIAARYQPDASRSWPAARDAMDKLSGIKMAEMLGEPAARKFVQATLGAGMRQKIKPADCPKIDRLMDVLQPLPATNMAALFVTLMEFSAEKDDKAPIRICPMLALNGK